MNQTDLELPIYNRETGNTKIITNSFDNWVDDFKWNPDSKSIFIGEYHGFSPIYKINISTDSISDISGERSISDFDLSPNGNIFITSLVRLISLEKFIF